MSAAEIVGLDVDGVPSLLELDPPHMGPETYVETYAAEREKYR